MDSRLHCRPLFVIASLIVVLLLTAGVRSASSTIIAPSRRVIWKPGILGGIPELPIVNNVLDFGAVSDNQTDNRIAFQNAINAAAAIGGGAVWVPAGTYRFTSTTAYNSSIDLRSGVVLRGAGMDATHLVFDFNGARADAVKIQDWDYGAFAPVVGGHQKDSNKLTLVDASSFHAGDLAEIQEENNILIGNEPWALNAVGEMVEIVSVSDNDITLAEPLHYNYEAGRYPVIRRVGVIEQAGIERMHLKREDAGPGQMVLIYNAARVWVREVESEDITHSHVMGISTYKCEIRDSYIHHAQGYGTGGQGYGVDLEKHATDCLVENNIFQSLRHSMVVQVGASGNVFAYNYSREPYADAGGWTPPDISIHGHFPSYNLFEGNVVQEVDIADAWGAAGPGNTFFRNCTQSEGIQIWEPSHQQNLIGNVLGLSPINDIDINAMAEDTLVHGNYQNGAVQWDPSIENHTLPASYYLDSAPAFFGATTWPAIAPDNKTNPADCMIPSRARWEGTPTVEPTLTPTPTVTLTPTPTVTLTPDTPAPNCKRYDFNHDNIIDLDDINIVLYNSIFMGAPFDAAYDLVSDGIVDIADIYQVVLNFGKTCTT
ncbi:MAG: dockerin [Proteobacteria bacterium]|nr:dockerin [Pseudomonadota bacterium]